MMHQPTRDPRPRKSDPTLLLAFLLPVFAWAPLTYPGYFVFRSGFLPIFNLADRLAQLGNFAWLPAIGTGYHLLSGDGGLPYLLAAVPGALGASPANAVKLLFGLAFVAGSVGAYAWTRRLLPDAWAALVAAAAYVFSPIWLPLVYVQGALAEAVLLALLPWVLWAADWAAEGQRARVLILALLAAACLWTQSALALAFLVTVFVYLLVLLAARQIARQGLVAAASGLLLGLLLGAVGWLPVLIQHGLGRAEPFEGWQWAVLLAPWVGLLAGWVALRLVAMLPPDAPGVRGAAAERASAERHSLFAALIGLLLLSMAGNLQPVAGAGPVATAPLAVFGANEIALLSVETEGTPGPGGTVALDVEWQALKPLDRDYTVFFHVLAADDQRYGQLDTMPQAGKLPTSQWQPGEVIRDRYQVEMDPKAPIRSDYSYWLGWYLGETGNACPRCRRARPAINSW